MARSSKILKIFEGLAALLVNRIILLFRNFNAFNKKQDTKTDLLVPLAIFNPESYADASMPIKSIEKWPIV